LNTQQLLTMSSNRNGGPKTQRKSVGDSSPRRKVEGKGPTIDNLREIVGLGTQMSQKNSNYEREIDYLRKRIEDFEEKNSKLAEDLKVAADKNAEQSGTCSEIQSENTKASRYIADLDKENGELNRKVTEAERNVTEQKKRLGSVGSQLEKKNEEKQKLEKELDRLNAKKNRTGHQRSEEDEKLIKDKDEQIGVLKRERERVQRASSLVKQELQQHKG